MGLTVSDLKEDEHTFGYIQSYSPIQMSSDGSIIALDRSQRLLDRFRTNISNENAKKRKMNSKKLKVEELDSLTDVNVCNRELAAIDQDTLTAKLFAATTRLILCCNKLTQLPPEIGMLNQLVYCSLSNNQLKSLPKEIGLLENLTELLVNDNMLRILPPTVGLLKNLTTLSVRGNSLESIPAEIGLIKKLIGLDLSRNPLKLIPSEIGCLNLRQLVLDDCPLLQSTPLFPDPERVCSLKELAARCIVRNSMDVKSRQLLPTLESYLGAFSVCSSCGGPFYENYVSRIRLVMRNDFLVPYESKLCVSHWSNEDDRIRFLFSSYPTTCRIPPAKQHPTSKPLYSNRFGREKASLQDTQQHIFLKRSASLTIIDTPKRDRNLSIALTRMTLLRGVSSSSLSMGH